MPPESDESLKAAQATIIAEFGDGLTDPEKQLPLHWRIMPHGQVSLRNGAVGFARMSVEEMIQLVENPTAHNPSLLLYLPRPRKEGETAEAYHAAITDAHPDPPYRLAGWAYGKLFHPSKRPRFSDEACVASHEWFVHEAGYHLLPSGKMALRPPSEIIRGSKASHLLDMNPLPKGFAIFHPRFWDLHVWRNAEGPPTVSSDPPFDVPGLVLPEGTFFVSEDFEGF